MKSIATLTKEYKQARKEMLKFAARMERIGKQIQERTVIAAPTLDEVKAKNEAERKKFGNLLHNGMKIAFVVNGLLRRGIITKMNSEGTEEMVSVTEENTKAEFNICKKELQKY